MSARVRIVLNRRLRADLSSDPSFTGTLNAAADDIAAAARRIAPGTQGRKVRVIRGDRPVVQLGDGEFGHLIEFGSVNNRPYAPLRSGAETAGYRVEES